MDKLVEDYKKYEYIALENSIGFIEIKNALQIVAEYISKKKLLIYGGMAIDFALKNRGHEGIYPVKTVPDYDFFSPNNISDSFELAAILKSRGFEGVSAYNAIHLTTRKVRINKVEPVADISFFPEPYYSQIPYEKYKGLYYMHPDFQRIDQHRFFSFLYEAAPRDAFRNRLEKDIKRMALINEHCPIQSKPKPMKNMSGIMLEHLGKKTKVDITKFLTPKFCISGTHAYNIYCEMLGDTNNPVTDETPEIYTEEKNIKHGTYYARTCDIFPESCYNNEVMFFNNTGQFLAASRINWQGREFYIANIHHTMSTFLFKYFMFGDAGYLKIYNNCQKMINNDLSTPFSINGDFFGEVNMPEIVIYNERVDYCAKKGIVYEPRPMNDKEKEYETYNISGQQIKEFKKREFSCPFSAVSKIKK